MRKKNGTLKSVAGPSINGGLGEVKLSTRMLVSQRGRFDVGRDLFITGGGNFTVGDVGCLTSRGKKLGRT